MTKLDPRWRATQHPVTVMADGGRLDVRLLTLKGRGDGPVVGISAAVHGDEAVSVEIVRRFALAVDPDQIRGTLVLLPVANPHSFAAITRHTPVDMMNLNRLFPGDEGGWLSEQLAAVINREFLQRVDVLIDLHAGGAYPTVDYVYILNAEDLSRSFGSPLLYRPDPRYKGTMYSGTTASILEERGARVVTVELGGGDVDQEPYIERGVRGLFNMLRTLRVLPGEPEPPPPQTVLREIAILRPRVGGLLIPEVREPGRVVTGGAPLGRVVCPYTFEELEILRAPFERSVTVLTHMTVDKVQPGDYGYMIGNLATAEGHLATPSGEEAGGEPA